MASKVISQTNFTSGKLSKRLYSQSGIEQYKNGLKVAENCIITPQGPVKKRPGTIFVDYAGNVQESYIDDEDEAGNPIKVQLIPFTTTTGINYLLEFCNGFMRVFRDGGVVSNVSASITNITSASPGVFTATAHGLSVGDIVYISGVGGMVILNGETFEVNTVPTADTFTLKFPFKETPTVVGTTGFPAYTSGGTVTRAFKLTTTYADVDELQYAQNGNKLYLAHPDHAPAILEYTGGDTGWSLYDLAAFPPPTEELGESPNTTVTPAATSGTSVAFTTGAAAFRPGDVGRQIVNLAGAGRASIISYSTDQSVTCTIVEDFPSTSAIASGDWVIDLSPVAELTPTGSKIGSIISLSADDIGTTTALACFRSTDVGKYIYINGGIVQITEYISTSEVKGEVLKSLESLDESSIWSLESPTWNSTRGYPTAIAFYEDRLWFGGTTVQPTTIWASEPGLYDAFGIGANDDDAISVQINSTKTSIVKWMAGSRDLVVGTDSSEITINSGTQGPITPASIRQTPRTYTGSGAHTPVIIDNEVLYLQDDKVRSFRYDFNIDNFRSQDLTFLANDLFVGKTLKKIVFAQDPDSIIYVLADDGSLFAGTFVREQQVLGWSEFKTFGKFKDIQILKNGPYDQLWCVVDRQQITEQRLYRRMIEYFDIPNVTSSGVYTDSSLKLNSLEFDSNSIYELYKHQSLASTTTPPTYFKLSMADDLTTFGLSSGATYNILIENCTQAPAFNGTWLAYYYQNSLGDHFIIQDVDNSFSTNVSWAFDDVYGPAYTSNSSNILDPKNIKLTVLDASSFSGLNHLGGWTVAIAGDGAEFATGSVSYWLGPGDNDNQGGLITISEAVHQAVIGIPYTMKLETLPVDVGGGAESFQNRTMRRVDILLRVHDSIIPSVNGSNIAHRDPSTPMNLASPLINGVLNYGPQDWGVDGSILITNDSPLPITINGIYSILELNRKA